MKRYFVSNDDVGLAKLSTYTPYGNILNWNSFSIDAFEYSILKKYVSSYKEIDKDMAIFGFRSFGDPRTVIKIGLQDKDFNLEWEEEIDTTQYQENFSPKISIPMTEKRYNCIVDTMKFVAKLILEEEFQKRYDAYVSSISKLEVDSWNLQKNPDFFSRLAQVKNTTEEDLKDTINKKIEEREKTISDLYLRCQELKNLFYNCKTIKELNVLYEDYFNIPMHREQAREMGRIVVDGEGKIVYQKPVGVGFNF